MKNRRKSNNKAGIVLAVIALFALPVLIFLLFYAGSHQRGLLPFVIALTAIIVLSAVFLTIASFKKK